jgi:hypothetical protein
MLSMAAVTPAAEAEDTQAVAAGSTGVADPSGDIMVADLGVATTAVDSEVDTTVVFTAVRDPEPTPDAGRWAACAVLTPVRGAHKRGTRGRGKVIVPATPLPAGISLTQETAAGWAARQVEAHPGIQAKARWQERACPRAA